MIEVALQLVMVAVVPLKVIEPGEVPKLLPDVVMVEPSVPLAGVSVLMAGPRTTVNETPLLAEPATVTTTLPVVAPDGTIAVMELAVQPVMFVALTPLKLKELEPCVEPKLLPEIVTVAPTAPLVAERLDIDGVLASADDGANRVISSRTAKIGGLTRAGFTGFIWTHPLLA